MHVRIYHKDGGEGGARDRLKCDFCDKIILRCGMRQHVRTVHLNVQKFSCDQCGATFTKNASRKRHVESVHQRLNRVKCDLCDLDFCKKESLKVHIQGIHEGVRFQCHKCEKTFSTKRWLLQHTNHVHPE